MAFSFTFSLGAKTKQPRALFRQMPDQRLRTASDAADLLWKMRDHSVLLQTIQVTAHGGGRRDVGREDWVKQSLQLVRLGVAQHPECIKDAPVTVRQVVLNPI